MWIGTGEFLGHFELLALLGEGGMARVYRARDRRLGRMVALKILPEHVANNAEVVAYFQHEAQVIGSLDHINIAALYDFLVLDGQPGLVMQLVEGRNLCQRAAEGPLDVEEALSIGVQVARALEAAHSHGIVHRDLKPANIMLSDDGLVKVLDFGIAQTLGRAHSESPVMSDSLEDEGENEETRFGPLAGTAAFMSPEHARGETADFCDDIWAFGCCLYFMLAGTLPFRGASDAEVLGAVLEQEPDWTRIPMSVPVEAFSILRMCLNKERRGRLSSARDLSVILEEIATTLRSAADDPGAWHPEAGETVPGRPNWVLQEELGRGRFGQAWLAVHATTHSKRVFKFCMDPERVRALKREVTIFRVIRETLGNRNDIAQVIDWQLKVPPYFIEIEFTETGDLRNWANAQGGIAEVPLSTRLELVAQVADAAAAAHSAGVLHKDIKPRNILVAQTAEGGRPQARLTDFGIGLLTDPDAFRRESLSTTGLTEDLRWASEGAPAGTRMYLAPEIVEGGNATIRSDIYALGVLLYQMAVGDLGKTIAPGWERQVGDELLQLDIGDCVEGSPEYRLESASMLADRIRRLAQRRRELTANREGRLRAERALHRRRFYVSAAVVSLMIATAVTLFALRERERASREASLRFKAEQAHMFAERSRNEALESMRKSKAERTRADENYRLARSAVDDSLARISKSISLGDPALQSYRHELLETALKYYQNFLDRGSADSGLRADLAWSYFMVSAIKLELDTGDWAEDLTRGLDMLDQLMAENASVAELGPLAQGVWRPSIGISGHWPRALRRDANRSLALYVRAVKTMEEAVAKYPGIPGIESDFAFCNFVMGFLLDDRPLEAVQAYRQCLEIWSRMGAESPNAIDYQLGVATSHDRMAKLYHRLALVQEVRAAHDKSSEAYSRLREITPAVPAVTYGWARHSVMMGIVLLEYNDLAAAEDVLKEAVTAYHQLVARYPDLPDYQSGLARSYARLGELYLLQGESEEAQKMFEQVALFDCRGGPMNHVAWLLSTHMDEELRDPVYAERFARQAAELAPEHRLYQRTLGSVQYRLGDYESAIQSLRQAILDPDSNDRCAGLFMLAMAETQAGNVEQALPYYEEACNWITNNAPHDRELRRLRQEASSVLGVVLETTELARDANLPDFQPTHETAISPVAKLAP